MKKLITLLAVLLLGTASVFAQWDCDVTWDYGPNTDCSPEDLPSQGTYVIEVTLTIYDEANGVYVTPLNDLPVNEESISATSSIFSEAQCRVSDYCDESHDNTPNFYINAKVAFVSSGQEFCSDNDTNYEGFSCNQFYNSAAYVEVTLN